jgi:phosphoglycolate phosphatase-like HAD superfamily hydrolase
VTPPAAVLDIDGTLVDSNYLHVVSWHEAFRQFGIELPFWRIHRAIGMGGDQLIPALAGEEVEAESGDDIRGAEGALYMERIDTVPAFPDAVDFVRFLVEKGHPVILSSSAKAAEVEHYLDLLGVRDDVEGWTTSADVQNTKPEPDVIKAGLEKLGKAGVGGGNPLAVMIGDSIFDVEAAGRAGLPTVALRTGGFGADELSELGAVAIFSSLEELREGYGKTPLNG